MNKNKFGETFVPLLRCTLHLKNLMGIKKRLHIPEPYTLPVSLIRFEGKNAILQNHHVGDIIWPISLLPANADVGAAFTLKLQDDKTTNEEQYVHLRKLLEELIN